jgi:tetratricopeptide (TPR) repeat protein
MCRLLFLPSVIFLFVSPLQAESVVLHDDFATDTRKRYDLTGTVGWETGALRLAEESRVGRRLEASTAAEVQAAIRFDEGPGAGMLQIILAPAGKAAGPGVVLRLEDSRLTLTLPTPPGRPAGPEFSPAGAGPWHVRLDLRYGLVRVRLWPKGRPEPAAWQIVRHEEGWEVEPDRVLAVVGKGRGVRLEFWEVRGPRRPRLSDEQQQDLRRAAQLQQQAEEQTGQGKYAEGVASAEQALVLRRKVLGPDHPIVAKTLDHLGEMNHAMGRRQQAQKYYEEGLAVRRKVLPSVHPDIAQSLNNLGAVVQDLRHHAEARKCYEEALAIYRKSLPEAHPRLAEVLTNLGTLYQDLGEYTEARQYLEDSLAVYRKALPPGSPGIADSLNNLAALLQEIGLRTEARKHHEEALAIRRKALPPEHPAIAQSLNNLATLLQEMGRPAEARVYYQEAAALYRKTLPADHPDLATGIQNLGMVLNMIGQPAEARKHFEEALAIRRKALPPAHPAIADTLLGIAFTYQNVGEPAEAIRYAEDALAIYRKGLPPGHPNIATCLGNLGVIHHETRRLPEARKCYEEALAIRRKALPPANPLTANTLANLGTVLSDMGRFKEAHAHLEEAYAIVRKTLPLAHPNIAFFLNNLGAVLCWQGDTESAWPLLRDAVRVETEYITAAAAGSAQTDLTPLLNTRHSYLYTLLSLAAEARSADAGRLRDVLAAHLDWRGLASATLLARQEGVLLSRDARTRAMAEQLRQKQQALADLLLQGASQPQRGPYRDLCERLQDETARLERDLASRVAPYAEQRRARKAGPAEIAQQLPPRSVLVEMAQYRPIDFHAPDRSKPWGEPHYLALLLLPPAAGDTAPSVRLVPLGPAAPLDRAIHAWRAAARKGRSDEGTDRSLRELVWGPLARALPEETSRLYLAPEGQLALLPFEAIRLEDGSFLVERFQISYLNSGRDLMPRTRPAERSDVAVLLADPDYDTIGDDTPTRKPDVVAMVDLPRTLIFGAAPPRRLPGFAREADAVEALLGKHAGWRLEVRRGSAATEEALKGAARPRLVYCITHGFFLEDAPRPVPDRLSRELALAADSPGWHLPDPGSDSRLRSGLVLAGANRWQERVKKGLSDGLLTAREAEQLDLWGTELVILSACDTGRGEVQVGEGVLGLRRAFQLAGAECVLASLWPVQDRATESLLSDFLRRWLDGKPPATALREAQLAAIAELRKSENKRLAEAPPLLWAGFICHGRSQ